jgi:hypothetical protein
MGVRAGSSYASTQLNAIVGGTTETVQFTTAPMIMAADNATVILSWALVITGAAAVGLCNVRLRRGTLISGTLVGAAAWQVTLANASTYIITGWYADMPGVAQTAYSLTWAQNGGSSACTFVDGSLIAFVL